MYLAVQEALKDTMHVMERGAREATNLRVCGLLRQDRRDREPFSMA